MITLIQRVISSSVEIDRRIISSISNGLLVFLGIEKGDTERDTDYLVDKIVNMRIFDDENAKMNLSIREVNGSIMVVSQFTLAGDLKKGNRPSFDSAESPQKAVTLYNIFISKLKDRGLNVSTGEFGAKMVVDIKNSGPVTFILSTSHLNKEGY